MVLPSILASSQDPSALKMRVKSLLLLVVPIVNALAPGLLPDDLDIIVDSAFVILAAALHVWGWVRAKNPA